MNLLSSLAGVGRSIEGALGVHPGGSQQTAPSQPPRPGNTPQPGYQAMNGGVPQGTPINLPPATGQVAANLLSSLRATQGRPIATFPTAAANQMTASVPNQPMNIAQGGTYNPGLVPYQTGGSYGVRAQPAPQTYWQNVTSNPNSRPNFYNPQVSDQGYFWNY